MFDIEMLSTRSLREKDGLVAVVVDKPRTVPILDDFPFGQKKLSDCLPTTTRAAFDCLPIETLDARSLLAI